MKLPRTARGISAMILDISCCADSSSPNRAGCSQHMHQQKEENTVKTNAKDDGLARDEQLREVEERLLQQLHNAKSLFEIENSMWELACFYSRTGRQEIAFQYVNQLLERMDDPGRAAECYLAMGQIMEQVGDYERAIEFYEQALMLKPATRQVAYLVHNNLGYCLNYVGRYQEAEPYCRTAINIDPQRYNAYKNLGVSLEGQGRIGEAARCYIIAVHANAFDQRALRHLENLIENNKAIITEINDIKEQLENCRRAVKAAREFEDENNGST